MRLLPVLATLMGLAASDALLKSFNGHGPEIWGSYNKIDDCEMNQAIECLEEQICSRRNIPFRGKIRCTIGTSVAYICNYHDRGDKLPAELLFGSESGGELSCGHSDLYEAWRQVRIAKGSQTGWWFDFKGKRTLGFDKRCKNNECDNGWKKGSEGEQCTNIHRKAADDEWLFDFEAPTYPNYTGKYEQDLPEPGKKNEPVYFNPWYEGKRPRRYLEDMFEWNGWEPHEKVEWNGWEPNEKVEWNGWEKNEEVEWNGWGPDPVDEWTPPWERPGHGP